MNNKSLDADLIRNLFAKIQDKLKKIETQGNDLNSSKVPQGKSMSGIKTTLFPSQLKTPTGSAVVIPTEASNKSELFVVTGPIHVTSSFWGSQSSIIPTSPSPKRNCVDDSDKANLEKTSSGQSPCWSDNSLCNGPLSDSSPSGDVRPKSLSPRFSIRLEGTLEDHSPCQSSEAPKVQPLLWDRPTFRTEFSAMWSQGTLDGDVGGEKSKIERKRKDHDTVDDHFSASLTLASSATETSAVDSKWNRPYTNGMGYGFRKPWSKEEVDGLVEFADKWIPTDGKRRKM